MSISDHWLAETLPSAIGNSELELYLQPQISLTSHRLKGVEALIRWHHPEKGMVSPGAFIPYAEKSGLIVEIGDWVIEEACRLGRLWQDRGREALTIGINLSAVQFETPDRLIRRLRQALERYRLSSATLELELTESSLLKDGRQALATMKRLRAEGFRLAIDDFGTGYSSLSYLRQMPVSTLKIDRAFVRELHIHLNDALIIHSLVSLAHSLGMSVIAEGAELESQMRILADSGCDMLQGFVVARPMSMDQLLEWTLPDLLSDLTHYLNEKQVDSNQNKIRNFQWKPGMSVDVTSIDREHQGMISELNQLFRCLNSEHDLSECLPRLQRLVKLAADHFAYEEKVMANMGYPNLEVHKKHHRRLLTELEDYLQQLPEELRREDALSIYHFTKLWLLRHLTTEDRKIMQHLQGKLPRHAAEYEI